MVEYPDLDVSNAQWIDEENFIPRYNIAPRSNAPVIRRREDDNNLVIHTMKWGVIPHWSKHEDLALNTINARAENLLESGGMWASMKAKKRCVVVCDGYFEWLKKGKDRLPHFIRRKNSRLMILAGLYDSVVLEGSSTPLWTFTVVTTDAAPSLTWLHDRQPVILSTTKDFEAWLDIGKGWHAGLGGLLKSGNGLDLECYPVPKEVGKVGTNSPSFIQPISQRKDGIEAMFAKQAAKKKQGNGAPQTKSSHRMLSPTWTDMKPKESGASTGHDGKTPKRVIELDSPSSPASSESPTKKPKTEERTELHNNVEGDKSPLKAGAWVSEPSSQLPPPITPRRNNKESAPGSRSREDSGVARPKSRSMSVDKSPSSTPKKTAKSKNVLDSGSTKITSFFRPQA